MLSLSFKVESAKISSFRHEHANKEISLISKHVEELKCIQLQIDTELRKKTKSLRSEHEAQLRALRCEQEDECRRLQKELDIQKTKEERQEALLQLQLKVMSNNAQEVQEVNSKKNYSIYFKRINKDSSNIIQHSPDRTKVEEKESPYLKATQTPLSNLLKKVENPNNLPKNNRKVTHHEYEIETSNGRTITKRRKTKSTVMFGVVKSGVHTNPSNIGDLFIERSMNPYADDPEAVKNIMSKNTRSSQKH